VTEAGGAAFCFDDAEWRCGKAAMSFFQAGPGSSDSLAD